MKKMAWFFVLALLGNTAWAQENALWMRYPAISPDGNTIVFSYQGDLYTISSKGGLAQPLTTHEAHDYYPVWSKDGQSIAFASDRYGNFDVFVVPATGGEARRLSFHSANDYPFDFSADGSKVLYGSARHTVASNVRFPRGTLFLQTYEVPAKGGRSTLVSAVGMEHAQYNKEGTKIIYQDRKGTEDAWRKHHTSSLTRDIWEFDLASQTTQALTSDPAEEREPLYNSQGTGMFYLSEADGTQNLYAMDFAGKNKTALTRFKDHPVRHLTRSANDLLCYSWNGEIYTQSPKGKPEKVNVQVLPMAKSNSEKILPVVATNGDFAVSPNGKELAFVFRGEVFVTAVEGGTTKRITFTPAQERSVEFSADGRTLYYATERNQSWDIYASKILRPTEPYFYAATLLQEEAVLASAAEEFQPDVSPDGKQLAYLEERNSVRVMDLASKKITTVLPIGQNFSYSDGDQSFEWSNDSKWLAIRSAQGRYGSSEVVLFKADGSLPQGVDITKSGFNEGSPFFGFEGRAILWQTDKYGRRPLAYQGSRETDIQVAFLDQESFDRFRLTKEEFALWKERDEKAAKDASFKQKDSLKKAQWQPDFSKTDQRKIRLTPYSMSIGSFALSPNGDKLWYTAQTERNVDLWEMNTRTKETKTLSRLGNGAGFVPSADGKTLFLYSDQGLAKFETESSKLSPISFRSEMNLDAAGERAYVFEHAWRQVKKKFYDPNLHGVNWEAYKKAYARFLPHINNNHDFQEFLSELLGELNASHTGGRFAPINPLGDQSAALGLFYDETYKGQGLPITEVISNGPADRADSKIRAGQRIDAIDGFDITAEKDWTQWLNRKAGTWVLLKIFDPTTNTHFEEVIKPIANEQNLLYDRWVARMQQMVDSLSGGKVGYVHVQGMNDGSFRNVYEEVLGKHAGKQALIVDTRFNGGGWLHEELSNFLSGKNYITFRPYGQSATGGEPNGKWFKPSCVLVSEANYSDAHTFPYAYRAKGIGKLIGMPVPGTSTSVWWETQIDPSLVFGIPMIGNIGVKEGRALENFQLEPDLRVPLPHEAFMKGKDTQIEAAVKEMLLAIGKN
ncbi:MAG: peptidase S41 [Sphingobacteriia bacterium]|nr:MAG: peptidase S41 [Sphingobacteriia bacterium]